MKSEKDIQAEIKEQVKALKKKGLKPELLLVGDLAYYTLKVNNPDAVTDIPNIGKHLTEYMDLRVVKRPLHESGGVFKAEHEIIEVFGR